MGPVFVVLGCPLRRKPASQFLITAVDHFEATVFDPPNGVGKRIEQSAVVGHKEQRPLVRFEGFLERFAHADIQVVGGLIEDEKVAADQKESGQASRLFSPPLNVPTDLKTSSPRKRKRAIKLLASSNNCPFASSTASRML